ncbi:MAG: hypothetical protein EBZ47_03505 [Chlamydiae bacterium]|nr:hypothetical protein [Chlamydiota bacterium]
MSISPFASYRTQMLATSTSSVSLYELSEPGLSSCTQEFEDYLSSIEEQIHEIDEQLFINYSRPFFSLLPQRSIDTSTPSIPQNSLREAVQNTTVYKQELSFFQKHLQSFLIPLSTRKELGSPAGYLNTKHQLVIAPQVNIEQAEQIHHLLQRIQDILDRIPEPKEKIDMLRMVYIAQRTAATLSELCSNPSALEPKLDSLDALSGNITEILDTFAKMQERGPSDLSHDPLTYLLMPPMQTLIESLKKLCVTFMADKSPSNSALISMLKQLSAATHELLSIFPRRELAVSFPPPSITATPHGLSSYNPLRELESFASPPFLSAPKSNPSSLKMAFGLPRNPASLLTQMLASNPLVADTKAAGEKQIEIPEHIREFDSFILSIEQKIQDIHNTLLPFTTRNQFASFSIEARKDRGDPTLIASYTKALEVQQELFFYKKSLTLFLQPAAHREKLPNQGYYLNCHQQVVIAPQVTVLQSEALVKLIDHIDLILALFSIEYAPLDVFASIYRVQELATLLPPSLLAAKSSPSATIPVDELSLQLQRITNEAEEITRENTYMFKRALAAQAYVHALTDLREKLPYYRQAFDTTSMLQAQYSSIDNYVMNLKKVYNLLTPAFFTSMHKKKSFSFDDHSDRARSSSNASRSYSPFVEEQFFFDDDLKYKEIKKTLYLKGDFPKEGFCEVRGFGPGIEEKSSSIRFDCGSIPHFILIFPQVPSEEESIRENYFFYLVHVDPDGVETVQVEEPFSWDCLKEEKSPLEVSFPPRSF